jgi:hypothetical protein
MFGGVGAWKARDISLTSRTTMPEVEKHLAVSEIAEILAKQHKLGEYDEVLRRLRYFTSEGLLETVGSLHTGSGRRRLYPPSAMITAVVLLRLFQSGATVGLMKDYMTALQKFTLKSYKTKNLLEACQGLKKPTIFLILPDRRYKIGVAGRLLDWEKALASVRPNIDFTVIQIERFL